MAFQQSTRQSSQRVARPLSTRRDGVVVQQRPSSLERREEESQTWVLFSPPTEITTTSYLSESVQSLETPGRSRLSDLGSLNTAARSEDALEALPPGSALSALGDQVGDEDAELDSLDSHLPEFLSLPGANLSHRGSQQAAAPVFPSHDGLGSFRLDLPILGAEARDQIYQFEKFNPRKIRRTFESFDHLHLNLEQTQEQADEKRQRIEAWRMEHSRVLLDEVQRETRRRKKSVASIHRTKRPSEKESDSLPWHDEEAYQNDDAQDGLIARLTRRVVKDLLGIDDTTLAILLGEELPDELKAYMSHDCRASGPGVQSITTVADEPSWQARILERLSWELGLLINHLSPHPGAFATFAKVHHMPLPYAGLPIIPEINDAGALPLNTETRRVRQPSMPEFQPTMQRHSQSMATIGRRNSGHGWAADAEMADDDFTKEEWEQSLDVKLVFRYVVSRFTSRSNTSTTPASHHTTPAQQDHAAKIARIRQHHPLTARNRPGERRSLKGATPSSPAALRHPSSCASHSTRRSARRSSCSSKHYWDIGGSLGTGSVIASNGPMGSWGEV